jgi:NAD-dependent SIR2 family protein deacetylase
MKNMEAYCVKCKHKTDIKEGKEVKNKKGMRMMKGKCPKCGTTVCRILGK